LAERNATIQLECFSSTRTKKNTSMDMVAPVNVEQVVKYRGEIQCMMVQWR
jgi:hypothetical protein